MGAYEIVAPVFFSIGALFVAKRAFDLFHLVLNITVRKGDSLKKYGAKNGAWAVVTGATAGIGLEFSRQLAKAGFNVFIASRSQEKLDEVAKEIESKYNVQTETFPIDFAGKATDEVLRALEKKLDGKKIGVLVNNVGVSFSEPTLFEEFKSSDMEDMIEINVKAALRVTKMVLPGMKQRRSGLILNIGSLASLTPCPYLSVYAASKGFLLTWSQALGEELRGSGVKVQLVNTFFVCSALSKIRKPKWDVPMPAPYVRSVLSSIGLRGGAVVHPYVTAPFWAHALIQFVVDNVGTEGLWLRYSRNLQEGIRKRVIRKRQRLAAAAANGDAKKEL